MARTEVLRVEIAEPIRPQLQASDDCRKLKLLVTAGGEPLGYAHLPTAHPAVSEDEARYQIASQLTGLALGRFVGLLLHRNKKENRLTEDAKPSVSIVLCTRDRPDDLVNCLESLCALQYPNKEIIVVDNNPASGKTRRAAATYPVVYVAESRPGLSYARNTGVRQATGEIIVCTDDDVIADSAWLDRLVQPFADPEVMGVTGLTVPSELETESQELFEEYGGLGRGFERKEYDSAYFRSRKLRAVPTWQIGATANAAFRKSALEMVGLFDVTLGTGTPTGCSEDTYVFYQLLYAGYKLVYEPAAFVYHRHRTTYAGLRKQLFSYSKGHYAYHIKCLLNYGDARAAYHMLAYMPLGYVRRIKQCFLGRSRYPLRLILWEIWGNALGGIALLQSTLNARRLERRQQPIDGVHVSYEIEH